MSLQIPTLALGARGTAKFYAGDTGDTDDGIAFVSRHTSDKIAPAGIDGECIVNSITLALGLQGSVSGVATLIVDSVPGPDIPIVVTAPPPAEGDPPRVRRTLELPVSLPHLVGGIERLRTAPRGTWVQLVVVFDAAPFAVMVEGASLDYEIVRTSLKAGVVR